MSTEGALIGPENVLIVARLKKSYFEGIESGKTLKDSTCIECMTSRSDDRRAPNRVFQALAASTRREILALLLDSDSSLTVEEIAGNLTDSKQSSTSTSSTTDESLLYTKLIHHHLPALDDAGLVQWTRDDAVVDTAPHQAFDDRRFRLLLEVEVDGLDTALSHLAIERRRVLLSLLRDSPTSLTQRDLAREILRSDDVDLEPDASAVEDVAASLYHVHLPSLHDASFIAYDPDAERAEYTAHPALEKVFTIIYTPSDSLVESYNGFFEGLETACNKLRRQTDSRAEWPHSWRDPSLD